MVHLEPGSVLQNPVAGFTWDTPADLSNKELQERLSPVAAKAFFKIVAFWNLRDEDARQLLGGISNGSYYQMKGGAAKRLDQDKLTRISLLIGTFKALNILYSRDLADAWIQLPNRNAMFAGETPLSMMISGGVPAMVRVRQLLDSRRGGQ